jgi:hypothetical protein
LLAAVEALPRRKGSLVIWGNGVVWRRIGDNEWEPLHSNQRYVPDREHFGLYPSSHVAMCWGVHAEHLKRLPDLDPEETP